MSGTPAQTVFLDGQTSRRRAVDVRAGLRLEIVEDGAVIAAWPWRSVRQTDRAPGGLRLRSIEGPPLARLDIADADLARAIARRCPDLTAMESGGRRSAARIVALSLAAAASILVVGVFGVPYAADRIAPLLPHSLDARVGDMVDRQVRAVFGGAVCVEPEGQAAFAALVEALRRGGGLDAPFSAAVLDSPVRNAVALPGGRVYLFRGMLEDAHGPDEIAGVLAHEMGHVQNRDGMRKLLQAGGVSYLLGLLFGDIGGAGAVVIATQVLLDRSYTRQAELRADEFAIAAMRNLGRSAAPMGELLVRVTGEQGERRSARILASHPFSGERLARMRAAAPVHTGPPLLDDAGWQALRGICGRVEK